MEILVTGGMGYIGSHTCVQMIKSGMHPIIVDNLSNAKQEVLNRIEAITGYKPRFYQGDIRDQAFLDGVFADHHIAAVIHFAGLKAVGVIPIPFLETLSNTHGVEQASSLTLMSCR